jgi:hypothetical protein
LIYEFRTIFRLLILYHLVIQFFIHIFHLFQLRHTRSPSDNTLHLNTNEFAPKKFTLERADSAGEAMQGYATRVDSAGETMQTIADSAGETVQGYETAGIGTEAADGKQDRTNGAMAGTKYSADSLNGLGRPVGMSYSCPRPFHYGGDGEPEKDGRIQPSAVRGSTDMVDQETASQEKECLLLLLLLLKIYTIPC